MAADLIIFYYMNTLSLWGLTVCEFLYVYLISTFNKLENRLKAENQFFFELLLKDVYKYTRVQYLVQVKYKKNIFSLHC